MKKFYISLKASVCAVLILSTQSFGMYNGDEEDRNRMRHEFASLKRELAKSIEIFGDEEGRLSDIFARSVGPDLSLKVYRYNRLLAELREESQAGTAASTVSSLAQSHSVARTAYHASESDQHELAKLQQELAVDIHNFGRDGTIPNENALDFGPEKAEMIWKMNVLRRRLGSEVPHEASEATSTTTFSTATSASCTPVSEPQEPVAPTVFKTEKDVRHEEFVRLSDELDEIIQTYGDMDGRISVEAIGRAHGDEVLFKVYKYNKLLSEFGGGKQAAASNSVAAAPVVHPVEEDRFRAKREYPADAHERLGELRQKVDAIVKTEDAHAHDGEMPALVQRVSQLFNDCGWGGQLRSDDEARRRIYEIADAAGPIYGPEYRKNLDWRYGHNDMKPEYRILEQIAVWGFERIYGLDSPLAFQEQLVPKNESPSAVYNGFFVLAVQAVGRAIEIGYR